MKLNILLVDDDKYLRAGLKKSIQEFGPITEASNADEAIRFIKEQSFDIAFIDIQMQTDSCGIEVLKHCQNTSIHPVILSSYQDQEMTKLAYQNGCKDFLSKLNYQEALPSYLKHHISKLSRGTQPSLYETKDPNLQRSIESLSQINLKDQSLFISGETGVGKTQIAKFLHLQNYQSDKNFIHINCAEIPENLIESELFGHAKGAFTGASSSKKGKLELADRGTLFLDEIATMSLSMQQKLLKAIDEKSFSPIGSNQVIKTKFTLICATCEDLIEKVTLGEFRKDLFYRISGFNLHIPPLRERKADLEKLIHYFINQSSRRIFLEDAALKKLTEHSWPGNIRELKNTIKVLSQLQEGIIGEEQVLDNIQPSFYTKQPLLTEEQVSNIKKNGLKSFIQQVEEFIVEKSLKENQGKIARTIKDLGISNSSFYRIAEKLKK